MGAIKPLTTFASYAPTWRPGRESAEAAVLVAYVDFGDTSTERFVGAFFPFALTRPIEELDLSSTRNKREVNERLNAYAEYVAKEVLELRNRARRVRAHTNVHNLTPLLLPLRNFASKELDGMLRRLFDGLGTDQDPNGLLREEVDRFIVAHPRTTPPDADRHCLCNGTLYFKSPGKHRHGFYRHSKDKGHEPTCLLNARSRLGGSYDYKFHYDCTPVRGKLAAHYPNCHGAPCEPKPTHVNIAPNDCII